MGLRRSLCFVLVLLSSAWSDDEPEILNPRGNRPVEHGYKASTCATEKQWPFCSDDDWGEKCPSGCRMQGLIDKADQQLAARIAKLRKFLDENRKFYRSTDQVTKETYDFLRDRLMTDADYDSRYMSVADQLRQRIVSLKTKMDRQMKILQALKTQIRDQVKEMQRQEVDIDIKLRTCKGSCASYKEYTIDKESYVTLDKQLSQIETMSIQSVETVTSLRVMKSRPLKDTGVSSVYKAGSTEGAEQKLSLFSEVGQLQLTLEGEGSSSSSAATVSKAQGMEHGGSSGTGSSSHSTSHTITCTMGVKKHKTVTKDGVVETMEITSGSPECGSMGSLGLGGTGGKVTSLSEMGLTKTPEKSITHIGRGDGDFEELGTTVDDFFKLTSGHSSTSHTKTITKTSSKGGLMSDTKMFVGDDLGAFMRGEVEDDLPDIHARSLKSAKETRGTDYVGKDCIDILQKHASGHKSGLFKIKPEGTEDVVEVYCDQDTLLGGWVLVQQRMDGSVNFNRTWEDYKNGFGRVDQQGRGELWLGNLYLHLLTQGETILRVELEDWEGQVAYAEYTVRVGLEAEGYALGVSDYTGDAGDALLQGQPNLGAFLSHANMKFSTYDRDYDRWEENCSEMYGGGWWYNNCQSANLNGVYYRGGHYDPGSNVPYEIENGVVWLPLRPADYSLKTVRMKLRRLETL